MLTQRLGRDGGSEAKKEKERAEIFYTRDVGKVERKITPMYECAYGLK